MRPCGRAPVLPCGLAPGLTRRSLEEHGILTSDTELVANRAPR